jgi:hypothetical protein
MMAEKLSIQIALEGGREIERQLADIGDAGRQAFVDIAKAADDVGGFDKLKPEVIEEKLKKLGVTGTEEIGKIHAAVKRAGDLESVVRGVQSVEAAFATLGRVALAALGPIAIAITAIGSAATATVASTVAFAESINKMTAEAQNLGLTLETFKELHESLTGTGLSGKEASAGIAFLQGNLNKLKLAQVVADFDALKKVAEESATSYGASSAELNRLTQTATEAGEAGKQAAEKLKLLGIPIPDSPIQRLREFKDAGGDVIAMTLNLKAGILQIQDPAERAAAAIELLGTTAGPAFLRSQTAAGQLENAINNLRTELEKINSLTFAPLLVSGVDMATAAVRKLNEVIAGFTWENFVAAAVQTFNMIIGGFGQMGQELAGFASEIAGFAWDAFSNAGVAAWTAITSAIQSAIEKVLEFIGLKPEEGSPFSRSVTGGFAHGGRVGGRGSGTSDSNLAWLSRGEYVTPARAVAQPGVLAFLEALRRSGGNLRRALDGMGRFALGGMVPRMPAFAAGGLNGMSNVTIQFPGLPAIGGLRASSDVVDELRKAAALAQVRSGGRKPSRYS